MGKAAFSMKGGAIVMAITVALFCHAPALYCSGPDDASPAQTAGAPSARAFAYQPAPAHVRAAAPRAPDFSHSFSFLYTATWGTASNKTMFSTGFSRLDWPMDFELVGGAYRASFRDVVEWGISLQACPWSKSLKDMKDYDVLDDPHYGYPTHDGVDIYSESDTDSKAIVMNMDVRVFPLSFRYMSMGLFLGYESQEMDYKAYSLNQTGYGPWAPLYTVSLAGPSSTYTLNYEFYSLGLTWRLKAGNRASLTVDTAYIPHASVTDQDEHLMRNRESRTSCDGTGSMFSVAGTFSLTPKWFVSSSCSRVRISSDGSQKQYWWGNDPATMDNDTGTAIRGIDAEMEQDSFRLGVALGCRL